MKLDEIKPLILLLFLSNIMLLAATKEPQQLKFLSETNFKNSHYTVSASLGNLNFEQNAIPNKTPNLTLRDKELDIPSRTNSIFNQTAASQPIAVFHGIGDNCGGSMGYWTHYFGAAAATYSKCIESGADKDSEFISTIKQAQKACEIINQDENFSGNFTIVAFSQGGLIGRYILQQCEMKGKVTRFITLGTPHMGISRVPWADGPAALKEALDYLINIIAFIPFINNFYSPLSYLNPPLMYESYRKYGSYLSIINNEAYNEKFHSEFKRRFENLEKLVLIKFKEDEIVFPKESAWFQKYDVNYQVQGLEKSDFYQQDYLGLRFLNETGKVSFSEFKGKHVVLTKEEVDKFIVPALLG